MDFNVRLSEAAFFLLLMLSATFTAGYQQGKAHAERFSPPSGGGMVCPSQGYIAIAPTTCPKA